MLQWAISDGSQVQAGEPMMLVDPSPEMAWESLRALYLIGQKDDLAAVRPLCAWCGRDSGSDSAAGGAYSKGNLQPHKSIMTQTSPLEDKIEGFTTH